MRRLLCFGLAVVVAMTAVAGCQRPAEESRSQFIFRNDSNKAYILGLVYGGKRDELHYVSPGHSRVDYGWSLSDGSPTAVRVYTLACEQVDSITLVASMSLLDIAADGRASVVDLGRQAEPSPSVMELNLGHLGDNSPHCGGGWYVLARNDSDQQVSITLSSYPGSWVVSAHTRSQLIGRPTSSFDSSRRVTIYTTGCQLLGDAGPLPMTAYVGIDAAGRVSLTSPEDFWVTTSADQDVSLFDRQSANSCASAGPGKSGNP